MSASQDNSAGNEVLFEVIEQVARVRLNRPQSRNAINGAVTQMMAKIVAEVESSSAIQVAVLESSTPGMFCAGADLVEIAKGGGYDLIDKDAGFAGFVNASRKKAWIASIDGPAFGGGCELALSCDMIVASENARFALPEVKRGLIAMAGGVIRLPRVLPRALAFEAIATGDPIMPEVAFAHGMINRLVPQAELEQTTLDLAQRIARNAPIAVRESLVLARAASMVGEDALWQANNAATVHVVNSEDAREGPRAFMEKREPKWSGT